MKSEKIKDISILLVEDEIELRDEIEEYLGIFFQRIYVAKDTKEAFDVYEHKNPDIIITDVNLPQESGLELVSKIRENNKNIKIIILSAHSDQDKLLKAVKLQLETYLIKPVNMEDLKKILLEIVDSVRKTQKRVYATERIYWDCKTNTLWDANEMVKLGTKENLLLKLLFSKPNQIFSAEAIFKHIYALKSDKEFSSHSITSLIKRLRLKLPRDIIENIYGSGYKISSL